MRTGDSLTACSRRLVGIVTLWADVEFYWHLAVSGRIAWAFDLRRNRILIPDYLQLRWRDLVLADSLPPCCS